MAGRPLLCTRRRPRHCCPWSLATATARSTPTTPRPFSRCATPPTNCALCLDLAEQDAEAFGAVAAAYTLPKQSPEEKQERSAAIAAALAEAGRVPGRVIALAAHLVELAELMRPVGNANVISDVAAAAIAARAAVSTARVNVEINLAGITDPDVRAELEETVVKTDDTLLRADTVTSAVREQILR